MNDTSEGLHLPSGYEGPRTPLVEEWPAVLQMTLSVFRPEAESYESALSTWPMGPSDEMRRGTLVVFRQGHPVSATQRLVRDILVRGQRLRLGYIGGVCTLPEHRGKGLAGSVLAAMLSQFRRDGVDFVHISGDRPLYYAAGADNAAIELRFELTGAPAPPGLEERRATLADVPTLAHLSQREGTRVARPLSDFEKAFRARGMAGRANCFYLVSQSGVMVGYLLCFDEGSQVEVVEAVGDRSSLLAASRALARERGAPLGLCLPRGDLLSELLVASGAPAREPASHGTIKVVSFSATMLKLQTYFQERLSGWRSLSLDTAESAGLYVAWNESGSLQIEGERNMLWALLGRPEGAPREGITASGVFQDLIEHCLPLPLPSVYLNMI